MGMLKCSSLASIKLALREKEKGKRNFSSLMALFTKIRPNYHWIGEAYNLEGAILCFMH